jgi:hypothetical protein
MTTPKKPPAVPATSNEPLPDYLDKLAERDVGAGVSSNFEDQLTPIINVLQTNSPQCDSRGPEFVADAAPGLFYLRASTTPIRETLDVIPCGQMHSFLEWRAGRQGLVGRHAELPEDVQIEIDASSGRRMFVRPDTKNTIQDTRELYLIVDGSPWMLPCYGTRHTFARKLMSYFNQQKHPRTGLLLPTYAKRYRLSTVAQSNAKGRWFNVAFADLGFVSLPEYQQAKLLHETVERGVQPTAALPGGTPRLTAA